MPSHKKILIAEDDRAIVEAMTMILEDAGYVVSATMDGHTVLQLKHDLPDLILLDVWMSGIDGREVCKKMKSQKNTKNIPIILVSANRDVDVIAQEAGANGFLAKPFELKKLLGIVEEHIKH
ncbi:MAG: response regulator [bacterium]|nr:response regulator [bacterium]